MMITRYFSNLFDVLPEGKVLIVYGPRRVGKTTLIHMLTKGIDLKYKIDS